MPAAVAPIVEPNLFSIADDWAGFPDDWLFSQITRRGSASYQLRSDVLQEFQTVPGLSPQYLESRLNTWHLLATPPQSC